MLDAVRGGGPLSAACVVALIVWARGEVRRLGGVVDCFEYGAADVRVHDGGVDVGDFRTFGEPVDDEGV